ncbi:TPA: DUF1474 family protein [Staphylococcus aureus]|uniref:type II toxin-antitoxin system toxin TscT n=1 Tax=Staphylococcus aureus TaxID=1280 RepID=UPI0011D24DCB|nr:DUF1474 family protein [Staphylococcus aureus]HDB8206694.1 DUF1474 family protein [Staphylococcus aureus]HDE6409544.1 DUF1474 family protein [Staphylococcus aureus]HDK4116844.1 DUF1474 family protein [Staphylococcus aureus]HDK4141221.1 DUF1474 family protein [Staphylococcus aureus]HDK4154968.1 DUF1474 family protein [Staphylococcus aureus]
MNLEIKDLFSDLKILKEKFEDLKDSKGWHFDELYPYEPNHVLNKDELIGEGFSYHERRIHNAQMFDLLLLYTEKFDELITRFDALEKASSFADQSQDNA